ncbi:BgTH12-05837 [Blumeria graminis f. sp. triticale]|uniref:Bgt-51320 n=2 Tax=Blumeria graminis TaxID=34373 RepID=A0A9X9QEQ3_BLUGR|nr:BgTH12-05837 [Blumeria graminis f. sp. triticale]VDB90843.1 Bgt-51320 [Blumeria graminis f. sp. tritici]
MHFRVLRFSRVTFQFVVVNFGDSPKILL